MYLLGELTGPPQNKNASDKNNNAMKNVKLLSIKIQELWVDPSHFATMFSICVKDNLCIDGIQLFPIDKSPICTGLV